MSKLLSAVFGILLAGNIHAAATNPDLAVVAWDKEHQTNVYIAPESIDIETALQSTPEAMIPVYVVSAWFIYDLAPAEFKDIEGKTWPSIVRYQTFNCGNNSYRTTEGEIIDGKGGTGDASKIFEGYQKWITIIPGSVNAQIKERLCGILASIKRVKL